MVPEYLKKSIGKSTNFSWSEALFLPRWEVYAYPTRKQVGNIIIMAEKLELIRTIVGRPMHVTSWLRPKKYNRTIGGASRSWHMTGGAVDFFVKGMSADQVRKKLRPYLEDLEIRMEDLPGSSWVHVDNKQADNLYFRP